MANKSSRLKMGELPFDIMEEILTRVPVKDLLRFRCVCRRWALLFKNKKFITAHMTFAPRKFLSVPERYHPPRSIIYQQDRKPKMIREEHDLAAGNKDLIGVDVVGHCNGLFCIQLANKNLAVWNPSLRELKKLPIHMPSYGHLSFGYDDTIDDYKIIDLRLKFTYFDIPKSKVHIFMIKSNPRVIDFPIDADILVHSLTQLGKNIFWLLWLLYDDLRQKDLILCFDIVSETFGEISFPHLNNESSYHILRRLHVVRRRLCLVETLSDVADSKIVIWATDQNRRTDCTKSWIKWFTVPIADTGILKKDIFFSILLKRCCDNNDKELLVNIFKTHGRSCSLLSYNVENNTFKNVETNFPVGGYGYVEINANTFRKVWHRTHEYIETMVSPYS